MAVVNEAKTTFLVATSYLWVEVQIYNHDEARVPTPSDHGRRPRPPTTLPRQPQRHRHCTLILFEISNYGLNALFTFY